MTKDELLEMSNELCELSYRFGEGWHEGIKIDALDIVLLLDAADTIRLLMQLMPPTQGETPVREDWGPGPHECHSLTAAPVQEPVAWRYRGILHDFDPSDWAEGPVTPLYTTPPAQPAPVQERNFCERCGKRLGSGIHTCTPPAAPVQEPDEWLTGCPECGMDSGCDCDSGTWNPPAAQRQWVRLTNEEIAQIYLVNTDKPLKADWLFARAIEAKLKEKNGL